MPRDDSENTTRNSEKSLYNHVFAVSTRTVPRKHHRAVVVDLRFGTRRYTDFDRKPCAKRTRFVRAQRPTVLNPLLLFGTARENPNILLKFWFSSTLPKKSVLNDHLEISIFRVGFRFRPVTEL